MRLRENDGEMPARTTSKRAELERRMQAMAAIDEASWKSLREELAPISESYLRKLIRQSGRPMSPLVEGVNTHSLEDAARTLCALSTEYQAGDSVRRKQCRTPVLEAKRHLSWSLAKGGNAGEEKKEILLWVSIWLENPQVFPDWIAIRRGPGTTEDRTIPP